MTDYPEQKDYLHACLFNGSGDASMLEPAQVAEWTPDEGVLWVHLDFTEPDHQAWLEELSSLNELAIEALLAEDSRPRITAIGDGLLIALRGVNLTPGAEPDDMVSVRLWIDSQRIISTRRRKMLSVIDLLDQFNNRHGPTSTADFLSELANRIVWRMSDTVDQFEDRMADIEDRVLEPNSSELRFELATLRRQAISLRRYLAPQRDALARLITEKVSWLDDINRLRLREVNDRLMRHIEDLDAVRERAAVTQEELLSRLSEQLNTRMYVLSVVAAVFLPLGFLTGLLGINVAGIPGSEFGQAFWVFVGLLIAVVAMQILVFRWRNWL